MTLHNTKTLAVVMTLTAFIAIGAVLMFLTRPAWLQVRELVVSIDAANTQLNAQYENRKRLLTDARAVDERLRTLTETSSQFIHSGNEIDFIKAVEVIADRNHVQHETRISDSELPSIKEFSKSFDLSFSGSYQDVLKTLIELERMEYLTAPITLDIRPTSTGGAALVYRGYFVIRPADI
jgi:hypothetical protein